MSNTVVFNHVEEFLAELDKDWGMIDRNIIRMTTRFTQSKGTPMVQLVDVVAAARMDDTPARRSWLVRLEQRCGDYWPDGAPSESHKTMEKRDAIHKQIEEWASGHGSRQFEVRAGIYE